MAFKSVPKTASTSKLGLDTPRGEKSPPGPHAGPIWARFWSSISDPPGSVFASKIGLTVPHFSQRNAPSTTKCTLLASKNGPRGGSSTLVAFGSRGSRAILSGGMKMRDEHGVLREVYISCHDFCHTFRWCDNEGRAWNA